LDCY